MVFFPIYQHTLVNIISFKNNNNYNNNNYNNNNNEILKDEIIKTCLPILPSMNRSVEAEVKYSLFATQV